jgi:hypothetical protein
MTSRYNPRLGVQLLGLACLGALVAAEALDLPPALRLPLALAAFLVVPGLAVVLALPLRTDALTAAALVVGMSVAADLLAARGLLLVHVVGVRSMLLSLGGLSLVCLLASAYGARSRRGVAP